MKLSELIPQKVTLKLSRLDRELTMNMITLSDVAWIEETFPGDEIAKIFSEVRVKDILRIACRILSDESKAYLAKARVMEIDECGAETELKNLPLYEKLYRILGEGELMMVINAIFDIRVKSQEIAMKEKDKIEKKSLLIMSQPQSGNSSMTSSPVNTDTPLSNSDS